MDIQFLVILQRLLIFLFVGVFVLFRSRHAISHQQLLHIPAVVFHRTENLIFLLGDREHIAAGVARTQSAHHAQRLEFVLYVVDAIQVRPFIGHREFIPVFVGFSQYRLVRYGVKRNDILEFIVIVIGSRVKIIYKFRQFDVVVVGEVGYVVHSERIDIGIAAFSLHRQQLAVEHDVVVKRLVVDGAQLGDEAVGSRLADEHRDGIVVHLVREVHAHREVVQLVGHGDEYREVLFVVGRPSPQHILDVFGKDVTFHKLKFHVEEVMRVGHRCCFALRRVVLHLVVRQILKLTVLHIEEMAVAGLEKPQLGVGVEVDKCNACP